MTTLNASLGFAEESTYGTPTTAGIRHYPFTDDGLGAMFSVTEADDEIYAGAVAARTDQGAAYIEGVEGGVSMYAPTRMFGRLLNHTCGAVSTTGPTDSNYSHSFTPSLTGLNGKSLTGQSNRPFHPSGANNPLTWHGLKILSMELGCEVDGFVTAEFDFDGEDVDAGTTSLAAINMVTPPVANAAKFPWTSSSVSIGGANVEARSWKFKVSNPMHTDRRYLRTSALKKEPTRSGKIEVEWEVELDYSDLTQYNRWSSTALATRSPQLVITCDGPVALAGGTVPRLQITVPNARIDTGPTPGVSGEEALMQTLSGVARLDGTNPLFTILYRSTDVTP